MGRFTFSRSILSKYNVATDLGLCRTRFRVYIFLSYQLLCYTPPTLDDYSLIGG